MSSEFKCQWGHYNAYLAKQFQIFLEESEMLL